MDITIRPVTPVTVPIERRSAATSFNDISRETDEIFITSAPMNPPPGNRGTARKSRKLTPLRSKEKECHKEHLPSPHEITASSLLKCNNEGFLAGSHASSESGRRIIDNISNPDTDWRNLQLSREDQLYCRQKASRFYDEFRSLKLPCLPDPSQIGDLKLSDEEMEAVQIYSSRGYHRTNPLLRGEKPEDASEEETRALCSLIASGLNKLPDFKGVIYRGLSSSEKLQDLYEPGSVIAERAFTSCSQDRLIACFPLRKPVENRTLFVIHSKRGKSIEKVAAGHNEKEVIFLPGTRFRVLGKREVIFDKKDYGELPDDLKDILAGQRIFSIILEEAD